MTAAIEQKPATGRQVSDYAVFVRVAGGVELYRCVGGCDREMQPATHGPDAVVLTGVPKHDSRGRCGACAARQRRGQPGPPPRLTKVGRTFVHALLTGFGDWIDRAACRGAYDADVFAMPDGWSRNEPPREAVMAARRFCARCPVLDECDEWAEQNSRGKSMYYRVTGLWGGRWRTAKAVNDVPMSDRPRERRRPAGRAA